MSHRDLKDRVYPQFARIAQAMASEKRLELVDLLAQAPRHVDALAQETGMSVANVSRHLQILRAASLVEAARQGNMTIYRLANPAVIRMWLSIREVAESQLAEMKEIGRTRHERDDAAVVSRDEAQRLLHQQAVLLDVRPRQEFESGHLPGAVNIPVEELQARVGELPRDTQIITYCRGEYCLFADEAADFLRARGFDVTRLEGGWPEWLVEGRPVQAGGTK